MLIAGGRNKGLDLGVLARHASRVKAVVAVGESAQEIGSAFAGVKTVGASSMAEAVELAAGLADAGDTVLLSPACASHDWYASYVERGEDFVRLARERGVRP